MKNNRIAVDLPFVIEQAIEATVGLAGDRPVAVIAEYPAHLPAVEGERECLAQVIASLIRHAIQHTDKGEVRVKAGLLSTGKLPNTLAVPKKDVQQLSERGPWALVSVSEVCTDVAQYDKEMTAGDADQPENEPADVQHTLSLAKCKRVIENYGGIMWYESQPDLGPRLNFTVPLRAARSYQANLSSLHRAVETRLPEDQDASHTLLLMVENDKLRNLLAEDLATGGYRVVVTGEGAEVLALARRDRPDLILLDIDARDPTAFDIAMVLKDDRLARATPILFLTSADDPAIGVRISAANFLLRPKGTGKLLMSVEAALHSKSGPKSRMLIVEPDDAARETMIMMIRSHGYRVTEASTPEEALAIAERLALGLILINAQVARERDYWLLRNLRQLSADLDILVLADRLSDDEGQAAISRGASGYGKTGELPDLLNQVQGNKNQS